MRPLKASLCMLIVSTAVLCANVSAAPAAVPAPAPTIAIGMDAPVSFYGKGAEAADVLKIVAKFGGMSMIADPTVKGTIVADLKGLTVRESLDVLCLVNGWSWQRIGNTIIVGDLSKVKSAPEPTTLPVLAIFELKNASAADVAGKLGFAIAADKVKVDTRTNTIIAQGSQAELDLVKTIINVMDVPVAAPVKAEAPPPAKPTLDTRVTLQGIAGSGDSFYGLITVDGKSAMVMDGDKIGAGISVVKVAADGITFLYDGANVVIGMEGSIK